MEENNRRLYVANLDWNMTEAEFRALFETCGAIEDLKLMPSKFGDRGNGGYGFVTMADDEGKQKALALNNTDISGRTIRVEVARPRRESNGDRGERRSYHRDSGSEEM